MDLFLAVIAYVISFVGLIYYCWHQHHKAQCAGYLARINQNKQQAAPSAIEVGADIEGKLILLTKEEMNTHTLCVGTTGSGKTNFLQLLAKDSIAKGGSVLCIDGKGDIQLARWLDSLCESEQMSFHRFHLSADTAIYNPFANANHDNLVYLRDLIMGLRQWTEPHYQALVNDYLYEVLESILNNQTDMNLSNLCKYFPKEKQTELLTHQNTNPEVKQSSRNKINTADQNYAVAASLKTLLDSLARLPIFAGQQGMNIDELTHTPQFWLFSLSPLAMSHMARNITDLIIGDVKQLVVRRLASDTPLPPLLLIIDEISALSPDTESLIALVQQARSANVNIVIGSQSLTDFRNHKDQLLANINNLLFLRLNSVADCEYASKLAGKTSTMQTDYTTRTDAKKRSVNQQTIRKVIQPRIEPDKFMNFAVGKGLIIKRSSQELSEINVKAAK